MHGDKGLTCWDFESNGRCVGGYNKHDTARLRFVKDIALCGLRFGKLVPADDLRMLRLPPMSELVGPDSIAMDAWAQRHGRDPRSQQADGSMTVVILSVFSLSL